MPIQRCQRNNKPGYKWGESGTCYTYTLGNKEEQKRAYKKALQQMRAIFASGYRGE